MNLLDTTTWPVSPTGILQLIGVTLAIYSPVLWKKWKAGEIKLPAIAAITPKVIDKPKDNDPLADPDELNGRPSIEEAYKALTIIKRWGKARHPNYQTHVRGIEDNWLSVAPTTIGVATGTVVSQDPVTGKLTAGV